LGDEILTTEKILVTAEEVLRRYGPAKATVLDVARALGVSHGSVYRHFPSKAALRDAVTKRWLDRIMVPLTPIAEESGPAPERLKRWLQTLAVYKHAKVLDDPELFATYSVLTDEAREVVKEHVAHLTEQVTKIIADGVAHGEFESANPAAAAQAVMYATTRFHSPVHAQEWSEPGQAEAFENVWNLILCGLNVRKS
jgi:AcrR family transcriptional regulator